jgi:hypothetical protein
MWVFIIVYKPQPYEECAKCWWVAYQKNLAASNASPCNHVQAIKQGNIGVYGFPPGGGGTPILTTWMVLNALSYNITARVLS